MKSLVSYGPGQRMTVVPDVYKDPPGPCSTRNSWTTDTVGFYPAGVSRSRQGAAFYKARVWHADYDGRR